MIALLCGLVLAFGGPSDIVRAERAYRAGEFARALVLYDSALTVPSLSRGPVLFNMGNCAYRLGRHAEAVVYYRRAALRLPRDAQVAFNLRMAEAQLGIERVAESFLVHVWAWGSGFTFRELVLLCGCLQGLGLLGLVGLWRRRCWRHAMALFAVLGLAAAGRLAYVSWMACPTGIVVAREIGLRPQPHPDLPRAVTLTAGTAVRVTEMSDRWARVACAAGAGWTERAGLGMVE